MKPVNIALVSLLTVSAGCGDEQHVEFNSRDGKFKIQFPGTPKVSTAVAANNIQVTTYGVESLQGAYMVVCYDTPNPPKTEEAIRKFLVDDAEHMFAGPGKGEVKFKKDITLQNSIGIEFTGKLKQPKEFELWGRSYLVGNRVYRITIVGSAWKLELNETRKYLDSFEVTP
jgi:hypothetical protein